MFDVKIVGGLVYDGSSAPPVEGDVGLTGDRIVSVGDLKSAEACRVFDADNCIVCPGFIDAHSHSDAYLLIEPTAPSKIHQGITTEIIGNCGCSGAPRLGASRMPVDWLNLKYPRQWGTFGEYRTLLEELRPAVNVGMLVGHNNLRASVMGYEPSPADTGQTAQMCALLSESLEAGAIGFSTGLLYPPGRYSESAELHQLLKVVRRHDGIYTTHMRSEGAQLLEAVDETIAVAEKAGCRLQISHLKTSGPANWHKIDSLLERIETARSRGVDLACDRYPYTAACTELDVLLPEWAGAGARREILTRLRDCALRSKMRAEIEDERDPEYWDRVWVGSVRHPGNLGFKGLPISAVARELGVEPAEAVLILIDRDELSTGGIFFGMSGDNMRRILSQPYVMLGTDASLRSTTGPLCEDHPHPRAYGAFTEFLCMARDNETVPVAEAIRKMTSLPAEHFKLEGRGRLKSGAFADIAVIDLGALKAKSTYAEPHQLSEGVRHLFVNGQPVLHGGRLTTKRGGRII